MKSNLLSVDVAKHIDNEIRVKCEAEYERIKGETVKKLVDELETQKEAIITKAAVRISRYFQVDTMRDMVTIKVDLRDSRDK